MTGAGRGHEMSYITFTFDHRLAEARDCELLSNNVLLCSVRMTLYQNNITYSSIRQNCQFILGAEATGIEPAERPFMRCAEPDVCQQSTISKNSMIWVAAMRALKVAWAH